MGPLAVEAENLVKRYGDALALDGVDLSIEQGELLCLLGPNGAGKSTFLLLLGTVLKPTSGRLRVAGYDVTADPTEVRRRVGLAFQEPKLFWRHTLQEMIDFHIRICGLGRRGRRRAEEVFELLDLADLRRRRGVELSGGQQKRFEVARLLIREPPVALFDEPTAGIDIHGKHVIWDEILRLVARGSTVIVATNDVYEAERLAGRTGRIGILDRGRLAACGDLPTLRRLVPRGEVVELRVPPEARERARALLASGEEGQEGVAVNDTTLRLYVKDSRKRVPQLVEHLLQGGVRVQEIKMMEPSLDDVFLQVTGRGLPKGGA